MLNCSNQIHNTFIQNKKSSGLLCFNLFERNASEWTSISFVLLYYGWSSIVVVCEEYIFRKNENFNIFSLSFCYLFKQISGAIATYLVILLQFRREEGKTICQSKLWWEKNRCFWMCFLEIKIKNKFCINSFSFSNLANELMCNCLTFDIFVICPTSIVSNKNNLCLRTDCLKLNLIKN